MDEEIEAGMLLNDEGCRAIDRDEFDEAINLLQRSISQCNRIRDWGGESTAFNNLAKAWFCKWAELRTDNMDLREEALKGSLSNGMRALSREVELCLNHNDEPGAGITVKETYSRLYNHAKLSKEECVVVYGIFIKVYVLPKLRKLGVPALYGPDGLPILHDLSK